MAGRPLQRRLAAQIQHEGAEDEILDAIASGKSLASVARKYDVSVRTMRRWVNEDPDRAQRYEEARQAAGEVYADRAGKVLNAAARDGRELTSAQATIASQRSGYYRWKAGILDKEQFGEAKQQVNVQVNLGDMHLDALRTVCIAATQPEPIPEAEYETVSEE